MAHLARMILPASLALSLGVLGCAQGAPQSQMTASNAVSFASLAIEGKALVPASLLSNNAAGIVAGNSSRFTNNGAGIVAGNSSRYRLFAVGDVPITNALAYLTDPKEEFYKINGKMITTTTNSQGWYRFVQGIPRKVPVIVNVILSENRRVVGFTVPEAGTSQVDLSLATTYVTEFLRQRANIDGKTMADYNLKKLPDLARLTTNALATGALAIPDLNIGRLKDMANAYALAVGQNVEGLGDTWAEVLGSRIIAATTVAGTGDTDATGDGKAATSATFNRLKSVCVDSAGNMYLADEGNHRIRKIDAKTRVVTTLAGTGDRGFSGDGGAATNAQLCFPRAVILDQAGKNLYIFDSQNVRVRKVDLATGLISTVAGNPADRGAGFWENGHGGDGGAAVDAKLFSPRGGAFDSSGNLYVVDGLKGTNYHTIRKITPDGTISTIAGLPGEAGAFAGENVDARQAKLNYTNQIFITKDDQLYMADSNNHCVRKIDLKTNLITTVAGVGGEQAITAQPGGQAATATKLNTPFGVAVDAQGQVFIAERGFGRVLVVKKDGKIHPIAGGGQFTGDGDARQLDFTEPHDLFVEADGNVLMADARNPKLRRLWTKFGL